MWAGRVFFSWSRRVVENTNAQTLKPETIHLPEQAGQEGDRNPGKTRASQEPPRRDNTAELPHQVEVFKTSTFTVQISLKVVAD